jgi:hypothetical protein
MVMTPATSAVTAATWLTGRKPPNLSVCAGSSAKLPMISGFSTMMYAIVTKVTRPPRTSRPTVDSRSEILKNRSRAAVLDAMGR